MDLLEFLVIVITGIGVCVYQAWASWWCGRVPQPRAVAKRTQKIGVMGPLPKPANDTWARSKAA
jgi:hypothetical protein